MTISTELRKAGPFAGNGATTAFPFSFKVFAASDVAVTRADTLGAETALVLNSDFTVALNPDQDAAPGGTITLAAPLSTGYRLVREFREATLRLSLTPIFAPCARIPSSAA